jgi:hypothetical protein
MAVAIACAFAPGQASALPVLQSVDGTGTSAYPLPGVGPGQITVTIAGKRVAGGGAVGWGQATGNLTGTTGGDFSVSGPLTCLTVSGKQASYKFRLSVATGAALLLQGGGLSGFVQDGSPDRAAPGTLEPAATFDLGAGTCLDPGLGAYQPLTSGDYTVSDLTLPLLGR